MSSYHAKWSKSRWSLALTLGLKWLGQLKIRCNMVVTCGIGFKWLNDLSIKGKERRNKSFFFFSKKWMAQRVHHLLSSFLIQFKENNPNSFELKLQKIISSVLYTHKTSLKAKIQIIIDWQRLGKLIWGLPIGDLAVDKLEGQQLGS